MQGESRRMWGASARFLLAAGALLALPAGAAHAQQAQGMVVLPKLAYIGNAGCTGSKCHSADAPSQQSGQMIGDELTIWETKDPHAKAFKTLADAKSKEIAGKLKMADAAADARCLSCHSMASVPEAQRKADKFKHTVGAGCESCHGPAEKYLEPHKEAGWYAKQRATLDAKGMRDTWGVFDTSHYAARAQTCVSCHLQIDRDMVDAGHPALEFEAGWYDTYYTGKDFEPHWTDKEDGKSTFRAALWAAGQAVSLEAAKAQVGAWKAKGWATAEAEGLQATYAKGVEIAKAQFGADSAAALEKVRPGTDKVAAAAKALAASAGDAKTKAEREIVRYGVAALTLACFESRAEAPSDPFYDAFDSAGAAEGAAFADAVKKMAEQAK